MILSSFADFGSRPFFAPPSFVPFQDPGRPWTLSTRAADHPLPFSPALYILNPHIALKPAGSMDRDQLLMFSVAAPISSSATTDASRLPLLRE